MEDRARFEEAVDGVLRGLRAGELVTYGEVAAEAGYPRHARAVGTYLARSDGRYPWWRVVTSSGRLVPGLEGEHAERLRAEGHQVDGNRVLPRGRSATGDRFDRAYFDRWYRDEGFGAPARLQRKVDYAVSVAEYLLDHPVRSVLDVGCGEGWWQPALRERRPEIRYLGVDPSRYAIERYGAGRNLRLGALGDLDEVLTDDERGFDLVVCVDVLGHVDHAEVRRGLAAIGQRLDGVALIETYAIGDDIVGDVDDFRWRTPDTYRRWFTAAGLHRVGPHLYAPTSLLDELVAFEQPLRRR